jgi:hypothetical protein
LENEIVRKMKLERRKSREYEFFTWMSIKQKKKNEDFKIKKPGLFDLDYSPLWTHP